MDGLVLRPPGGRDQIPGTLESRGGTSHVDVDPFLDHGGPV